MKPTEYSGDVESVAFGETSFMDVSERVKTVPTQLCESNQRKLLAGEVSTAPGTDLMTLDPLQVIF